MLLFGSELQLFPPPHQTGKSLGTECQEQDHNALVQLFTSVWSTKANPPSEHESQLPFCKM